MSEQAQLQVGTEAHQSVNNVKSNGKPPVQLSEHAHFLGGEPLSAEGGGIVILGETTYSVARPDLVPAGQPAERGKDGSWTMQHSRIGRITILEATQQKPTFHGAELEYTQLDEEGDYTDFPLEDLLRMAELYSCMGEDGTKPTGDPTEFKQRWWNMVHKAVDTAAHAGHWAVALAVFGQRALRADEINPHPYVKDVAAAMSARTGFDTLQLFRTISTQSHTEMSDTWAGIQAAEAMQLFSPVLMSPSLSAPFVHGGMAGNLAHTQFTPEQQAHMARAGITPDDLSGQYLSWRYVLRLLGSPSAGVWREPVPGSMKEYLARADEQLATGEIATIDRTNGWHSDRARIVLDGSANTFEACHADPGLGNGDVMAPLQLLGSAVFTALEKTAMNGYDPSEIAANALGIAHLDPASRLQAAHRAALHVSRYGNDAAIYGHRPNTWLKIMLRIADFSPYTVLTNSDRQTLQKSYATYGDTVPAIRQWCRDHHTDTPTAQTWFDLGLNNPAVYMRAHYDQLIAAGRTPEAAAREVELTSAKAMHQASYRQRENATDRQAA